MELWGYWGKALKARSHTLGDINHLRATVPFPYSSKPPPCLLETPQGAEERGRRGEGEMGRLGDWETGRLGDGPLVPPWVGGGAGGGGGGVCGGGGGGGWVGDWETGRLGDGPLVPPWLPLPPVTIDN